MPMVSYRWCLAAFLLGTAASAANLGRVIPVVGGASDITLDERRGRLYLTANVQNTILIYNVAGQNVGTIATDSSPLSTALSRDSKFLYVTCYDGGVLDVVDLDTQAIARISLPARPLSVAVGRDGRVLISTAGSGTNAASNLLLLYDPAPNASPVLSALTVTPPAPAVPVFPPPSNRPFLSKRSQLTASRDGSVIAGVNIPATGAPAVFVYETASNTVLRSRLLAGVSTALAVSDDGTRVAAGAHLFDTYTLQVLAQQNLANSSYPIDATANFALAANQGGRIFAPDGRTLYSAFNIPPVQATGVSQLMLNDPDNLLLRMGIQLPENLSGRIVVSADGANAYALSDSGFIILPLSTIAQSVLAVPASGVALVSRDQCGVLTASTSVTITNAGRGAVTATAQLQTGQANQGTQATAPTVRAGTGASGPQITFGFNTTAGRGPGTFLPAHDFIISSPQAINIPDRVRVFQNNRDSDARGTVLPVPVGISAAAGILDLVFDSARQRVYLANAGLNRVEVYDIRQRALLAPIKVGQLPSSMALTADGSFLYVANSGGESISVVDPDRLQTVGNISYPALPFNSNLAITAPSVIASSLAGTQVLMTDGSLWKIVGDSVVRRGVSRILGQNAQGLPVTMPMPSTLASTPGGEYILMATPTGFAYLFDANSDDWIAGRQVSVAALGGYIGPIAAGPRGQYFVVNGTLLNQALVASPRTAGGLISAVAPAGNTSYAVYSPPATAANAAPTAAPTLQLLDASSGNPTTQISALEGPSTIVAAAGRGVIGGRTMAIDTTGGNAYIVTASGLSIIPLTTVPASARPVPTPRGAVNLGSYQTQVAANGLLSIFGQNMATEDVAQSTPLPTILGGTCVTLNNIALPLFYAGPTQINAQIPPNLAAGNYPLVVRSITRQAASTPQQLAVSRVAPAVLVDAKGQPALFHEDGKPVNQDNPAKRDEPLTLYAVGLGPTTGGAVVAGLPSPSNPLAETGTVRLFFGDPAYKQSEVIVDWSGLTPGFVGLYQLNIRVPGFHEKGPALPVTIRMGTVNSPVTGPVVPYVAVE